MNGYTERREFKALTSSATATSAATVPSTAKIAVHKSLPLPMFKCIAIHKHKHTRTLNLDSLLLFLIMHFLTNYKLICIISTVVTLSKKNNLGKAGGLENRDDKKN